MSLPPQIPGGKRLEPSAACRPRKGQPDKHPLLGKRTKDHQSEVLLPSGGKPWFRFSIYASHVRYGNFSPGKRTFPYHAYPIARRGIIHTNTKAVCTAANDDDLAACRRLFLSYSQKSFFCCSKRTVSIRSFSKKWNCFG